MGVLVDVGGTGAFVGVFEGIGVREAVGDGVQVGAPGCVGGSVGVLEGVSDGVGVKVRVAEGLSVEVGSNVAVGHGLGVLDAVGVEVPTSVAVGFWPGSGDPLDGFPVGLGVPAPGNWATTMGGTSESTQGSATFIGSL